MRKEDQLIKRCIDKNRDAQRELYNKYSPVLYGICLKYMKNEHDAKDVFQEAFVLVYDKIHQFNFQGSFEGWIKRLFINKLIDTLKHKKKEVFLLNLDIIQEDVEEDVELFFPISQETLLSYVQSLPDQYRLVFNLYVFENKKHKEIAEVLGISEGTSKSNLSRAKSNLRKKIEENLNYITA